MVINNFYPQCITVLPFEADAPLVVNADAILPCPISAQPLQPISWRHPQILKSLRLVEHAQFPQRHLLDIGWQSSRPLSFKDLFCFLILKISNHTDRL
jgi:hypothetical protein